MLRAYQFSFSPPFFSMLKIIFSSSLYFILALLLLSTNSWAQGDVSALEVFSAPAAMPAEVEAKQLEATKNLQLTAKYNYKLELAADIRKESEAEEATTDILVTMTAYSSTVDQTDDTPFITSTQQPVRLGIVAVSRDLLAGDLPYGTTLRVVETYGEPDSCGAWDVNRILEVQDTMHRRKQQQIDLWLPSREEALEWGYCQARVEILEMAATTQPHWWSDMQQHKFFSVGVTAGLLGQIFSNPTHSSHLPHLLSIFGMVLPHISTMPMLLR